MTVSISVERYIAIFFPMVYKARSQGTQCRSLTCHIVPVLLLAALINLPTFFASKLDWVTEAFLSRPALQAVPESERPALHSSMIGTSDLRRSEYYAVYYHTWTRFLLLGLIPMLLLIVLNVRVFSAIQARKSTCRDASYSNILLLIVIVFLLCHSPRLFLNFYEALWMDREKASRCHPPVWFDVLHVFSNCLITLNSALNFFIYCLAGAKFRQGLSDLVCCRQFQPGVLQTAPPSTSHTAIDLKSYSTRL